MRMINHMKIPALRTIAVAASMACTGIGNAQTQTYVPVLKEVVVVSGSRNEQLVEDLPLAVDVISAQDLEADQVGDIRDAVRTLPNVSVKRAPARYGVTGRGNSVGADGNAGFNIRGMGGNRVVMLVDGVRLPRSYINGSDAFSRDTVAVGVLKRIEVIHGPASVLYGSDALAGLVNFITLEPSDYLLNATDSSPKSIGGKAWLSYSGDDQGSTVGGTVAVRANEAMEWSLTGVQTRASALGNMGSNDAANVDRTTPNPQTNNNNAILGKLVLHPSGTQRHAFTLEHVHKTSEVELLSSRVKTPVNVTSTANAASAVIGESSKKISDRDRGSWEGQYRMDTAWADRLQLVLSAQNSHALDDGYTLLKTAAANDGKRVRIMNYDERTLQGNVQADKVFVLSPQWSHKLTYGLDVVRTDVSSFADGSDPAPLTPYIPKRYFPDMRDSSQAVYVQSEWISDAWSITPGVRYDQFALDVLSQDGYYPGIATGPGKSLSGSAVTPKLGAVFRVSPQWAVYGNYAAGFRAPEGQQLNSALEVSTAVLLPNPDLKQEESNNFEIGTRVKLDRLSLDFSVFSGVYTNLIVEKKDLGTANGLPASTTNKTRFQTVNIDKATISGFEIRGNYDWGQFANGRLSSPFGYGFTRGTNDATGLPLNYIEPAKLAFGLKYETSNWDVRLDAVFQDEKKLQDLDSAYIPKSLTQLQFLVPASTTLNLSGQWRIRKDIRMNLAINNLTDRKYWNWSDVQGLASNASPVVVDAYTQPGRHASASLVVDF
nr:TonB-dependent hemoglobin/transferrin/lactoferrin family receptor [Rhodoferax sp.]